jgi:hypothetical protein
VIPQSSTRRASAQANITVLLEPQDQRRHYGHGQSVRAVLRDYPQVAPRHFSQRSAAAYLADSRRPLGPD